MDKLKVGIPKVFFNDKHEMWKYYFEKLDIEVVFSKDTDNEIVELGIKYANDEMCMSLKTYLGHVAYLLDKCDYILVPRICNYGRNDQTCTNFASLYDLVNNLFNKKVLNYNIDYEKQDTELKGLIRVGKIIGRTNVECKKAYEYAKVMDIKDKKRISNQEFYKLNSNKKKVLLVGHGYVCSDHLTGKPIIDYLKKLGCEVIEAYKFHSRLTTPLYSNICKGLYWKHNKDLVGSIELCKEKVDGIILLSIFPCGPDSLVNELIIRRIDKPIIQLIMDDTNSFTGIETRLESFLDILQNS